MARSKADVLSRLGPKKRHCVQTVLRPRVTPEASQTLSSSSACLSARKGYRTDATVSVFLGFLLFLIPAKKPCFGKKNNGEKRSREEVEADCSQTPSRNFQKEPDQGPSDSPPNSRAASQIIQIIS